jgi:hypothetical protein
MAGMAGMSSSDMEKAMSQLSSLGGKGKKINYNLMQEQLNRNIKMEKTKERMRENIAKNEKMKKEQPMSLNATPAIMTDEEVISFVNSSKSEPCKTDTGKTDTGKTDISNNKTEPGKTGKKKNKNKK